MGSMKRSASTPTLTSTTEPLEVYVAMRALVCKLPHVPEAIQNGILRDIGCAHYYTVIRSPVDGTLRALDFGPVGGRDIAFQERSSLWSWARKRAQRRPPPPKHTPGEVREMLLAELPESCMFVGRTNLSLHDIRSYNALQNKLSYVLHKSDCRHYVNNLVQYACGVQAITRQATREIYTANRKALAWKDRLVLLSHNITDVGQWPRVQRATQTAMTVFLALGGRRTASKLGIKLPLPSVTRAIPVRIAARPALAAQSTALTRVAAPAVRQPRLYKPVLAAAGASYAAEGSLLSSLGETVKSYGAGIGSTCRSAAGRAGQATAGSLSRAAGSLVTAAGLVGLRSPARQPQLRVLQRPAAPSLRFMPRRRSHERQTGLLVTSSS